ncbi:tetratricopeptide repeat protein [Lonepinella sp. BR2919]|uniref:tetratricopeptide repeat protein n=1 Tax=unclassified Lonepinella TaxID=2642006 RepID=UPI003F6DE32A
MFKKLLLSLLIGMSFSTSVCANEIDELTVKAESGDPIYQFELGKKYSKQKDYQKSFYWIQKAAEQGVSEAQVRLGALYFLGQGVQKDAKQAFYWFEKGAKQGNDIGQYMVGSFYRDGNEVKQDYKQAIYWYQKSAEQGNSAAQNNLATYYEHGIGGLAKNEAKAVELYRKSAEQGDEWGQWNLGLMYKQGKGVATDYKQAFEWLQKSANQGFDKAQFDLGLLYDDGEGVKQDKSKAAEWYQKAAAQGNAAAQNNLGVIYFDIWKDKTKGLDYFVQACKNGSENACENQNRWTLDKIDPAIVQKAKAGDAYSMSKIAEKLYFGGLDSFHNKHVDTNEPLANTELGVEWYEKAFKTNKNFGAEPLFEYYEGKKDYDKAFIYLEALGERANQLTLADYYFYGKGTEKDFTKALEIYAKKFDECQKEYSEDCKRAFLFMVGTKFTVASGDESEELMDIYGSILDNINVEQSTKKLIERAELLRTPKSSSIFDFFKTEEKPVVEPQTELLTIGLVLGGAKGFVYIKDLADQGNAIAQYWTALAYNGDINLTTAGDLGKFKHYIKLACENGVDGACSEYNSWNNGYDNLRKYEAECQRDEKSFACDRISNYRQYEKWGELK